MSNIKIHSTPMLLAGLLLSSPLMAQRSVARSGELFPEPFLVEHRIVQTDHTGDVFTGQPVTDYYGGSWIVSERPDGSRLVIDLARRDMTEIRVNEGVYYSLSFDRFAELRGEMARFEAGFPPEEEIRAALTAKRVEPTFKVSESPGGALKARQTGLPGSADAFLSNPGVRHIRVELDGGPDGKNAALRGAGGGEGETMDVWCDESVKLTPNALAALERFEQGALGPPAWLAPSRVAPSRFLAAARRQADGAFPVRTVRPIDLGVAEHEKSRGVGESRGSVEDVTVRLEKLEAFPLELVSIPDGLRRTAHPLESMAAFAEKEEERERIMGQPVSAQTNSNE